MSNILYTNQRQLNQKPIYNPTEFNNILETTDADLIGFFDELYEGTNPASKLEKTNNNNKKKLGFLCYFLASIKGILYHVIISYGSLWQILYYIVIRISAQYKHL